MKRITKWLDPKKNIDSQYGYISIKKWCSFEVERISSKDCFVDIKKDKIAIFINQD